MPNVTDAEFIALCNYVQAQAERITGGCMAAGSYIDGKGARLVETAGQRASALCDYLAEARQRVEQAAERTAPDAYALSGLAALPMTGPELGDEHSYPEASVEAHRPRIDLRGVEAWGG